MYKSGMDYNHEKYFENGRGMVKMPLRTNADEDDDDTKKKNNDDDE